MLMETERERLIVDVLRASYEAVTLDDVGAQILPFLERIFDTSTSLLYRLSERGEPIAMSGGFREVSPIYFERYAAQDPLQAAGRRIDPLIARASRLPEWKRYLKHPAYIELCHPNGLDYFVHLRLLGDAHLAPGMVGLLLARPIRGPDFNDRDELILARLLPAFEALARRSARLQKLLGEKPFAGALLDLDPRPKIALDRRGSLLWTSERAETLLNFYRGGRKPVPDALAEAARRLGALAGKNPSASVPPASIAVPRKGAAPLHADLRLVRARNGEYFILAELEDPGTPPPLNEVGARYRLTAAEIQVLHLISLGLSDREISRRLFVSKATVHSHVTRIFGKLGVRSRVQAALLAHGLKPDADPSPPR